VHKRLAAQIDPAQSAAFESKWAFVTWIKAHAPELHAVSLRPPELPGPPSQSKPSS
jgi:hypothetical protein